MIFLLVFVQNFILPFGLAVKQTFCVYSNLIWFPNHVSIHWPPWRGSRECITNQGLGPVPSLPQPPTWPLRRKFSSRINFFALKWFPWEMNGFFLDQLFFGFALKQRFLLLPLWIHHNRRVIGSFRLLHPSLSIIWFDSSYFDKLSASMACIFTCPTIQYGEGPRRTLWPWLMAHSLLKDCNFIFLLPFFNCFFACFLELVC